MEISQIQRVPGTRPAEQSCFPDVAAANVSENEKGRNESHPVVRKKAGMKQGNSGNLASRLAVAGHGLKSTDTVL